MSLKSKKTNKKNYSVSGIIPESPIKSESEILFDDILNTLGGKEVITETEIEKKSDSNKKDSVNIKKSKLRTKNNISREGKKSIVQDIVKEPKKGVKKEHFNREEIRDEIKVVSEPLSLKEETLKNIDIKMESQKEILPEETESQKTDVKSPDIQTSPVLNVTKTKFHKKKFWKNKNKNKQKRQMQSDKINSNNQNRHNIKSNNSKNKPIINHNNIKEETGVKNYNKEIYNREEDLYAYIRSQERGRKGFDKSQLFKHIEPNAYSSMNGKNKPRKKNNKKNKSQNRNRYFHY